jgi:uncharacterized protein YecE (DUF72 family)
MRRVVPGVECAMAGIHLGTSAFTTAGWEGSFYPEGMKPTDFLTYYATKFDTVEVDSTFYRTPSVATVNGWERETPKGFILAAFAVATQIVVPSSPQVR